MKIWLPPSARVARFKDFFAERDLAVQIQLSGRHLMAIRSTQAFCIRYKVPNLHHPVEVQLKDLCPGEEVEVRPVNVKEEIPNAKMLESLYQDIYRKLLTKRKYCPIILRADELSLALEFVRHGGEFLITVHRSENEKMPVVVGGREWWCLVMPVRPEVAESYLYTGFVTCY